MRREASGGVRGEEKGVGRSNAAKKKVRKKPFFSKVLVSLSLFLLEVATPEKSIQRCACVGFRLLFSAAAFSSLAQARKYLSLSLSSSSSRFLRPYCGSRRGEKGAFVPLPPIPYSSPGRNTSAQRQLRHRGNPHFVSLFCLLDLWSSMRFRKKEKSFASLLVTVSDQGRVKRPPIEPCRPVPKPISPHRPHPFFWPPFLTSSLPSTAELALKLIFSPLKLILTRD